MNRRVLIAATAAAVLAGGAWLALAPQSSQTAGFTPIPAAEAQSGEVDTSGIAEMTLGSEDAAVEIVEYASFTCPHCATFHQGVFEELKRDYIDTGKVHFVYREVYFDRPGLWASMMARCGGEMRFFGIADMLYEDQREWTASGDPATIAQNLRRIGLSAGLDADDLNACMQDADKAQALYAWYQQNVEQDDITSTPSFVIDGEKYSNMSYAEFREILDPKLED